MSEALTHPTPPPRASTASGTLFRHASVIDGLGNAPHAADVLVVGTRIERIGADAASEARRLGITDIRDLTGRTLMPGLIDAHCHISFDEVSSNDELFFHRRQSLAAIVAARNARRVLTAGVTSICDADSVFELTIDLRDAIEAGVVEGPRISTGAYALLTSVGGTAGRLIPDEGTVGYGRVVRTLDEIKIEVRRQIKAGVDWIKVHSTGIVPRKARLGELQVWTLDEMRLVCEVAHDLGTPVMAHCRGAKSVEVCAHSGVDLLLHATGMTGRALEKVVEKKIPIAPTFTFQANLADYGAAVGADPALQAIFKREIADSAAMLRRAYDHGVPLLCGSESGFSMTPYGDWHHREMEVFVQALGLTPLQAIACCTSVNAKAIQMDGQIGRIEVGCLADLLVVDGDPSRDISVLGDPARRLSVFKDGREVDLKQTPPDRKAISGWRVGSYGAILTNNKVRAMLDANRS